MKAVDTNVLLRFFVEDENSAQSEIAHRVIQAANADNPVYVPDIVTAEVVWVLRKRLNYPRHVVGALLRSALSSAGIVFEHGDDLLRILTIRPDATDKIADNMVALAAAKAGCSTTMTFDQRAAKAIPGMELLA